MTFRPLTAIAAIAAASCTPATPSTSQCPQQLGAGDLVITELMANPGGTDSGNEWIEIHNATDREIDLSQLRIQVSKADGTSEKVHVIGGLKLGARKYVALGDVVDVARPAWIGYSYGKDFGTGLPNDSGKVTLSCGSKAIDQVVYMIPAGTKHDGHSHSLDGKSSPDAIANDDLASWCDGVAEFTTGAFGTPGAANEKCVPDIVVMPDMCKDPVSGMPRSIVKPAVGQLVFDELMPNPMTGTDETKAEWVELTALSAFDLNGLQLASSATAADLKPVADLAKPDCLPVKAGDLVLLARSPNPLLNGGLPGTPYAFTIGLSNSGGTLSVGVGGAILDTVVYPTTSDGVSLSLDPGSTDASKNDDAMNWCKGSAVYGPGGKGTPGMINPSCGAVVSGKCMDNGTPRDKVVPVADDLMLTEVMPDPDKVVDTAGEWFEIKALKDVDLNGVQYGVDLTKLVTIPEGECRRVTAGTHLLFTHPNVVNNGGLPMTPAWQTFGFSLTNASGTIYLAIGGQAIDQFMWAGSTAAQSWSRDPVDGTKWCKISDNALYYNGTDRGTPGAATPACP